MFCIKCGKQINDNSTFCPFCGNKIQTAQSVQEETPVTTPSSDLDTPAAPLKADDAATNEPKPKKKKPYFLFVLIPILIAAIAFGGYFAFQKIVEKTIIDQTTQFMDTIKKGPSEETIDNILEDTIPSLISNEFIAKGILHYLSGEDVLDVYHPLMKHMDYEIKDINKVDSSHYKVSIKISNMNNKYVAEKAVDMYTEKYKNNNGIFDAISNFFSNAKEDWGADKSQLIAENLDKASDELYSSGDKTYRITKTCTIDIMKKDGSWAVTTDYVDFARSCFGL